jgi:altronate hydrolase
VQPRILQLDSRDNILLALRDLKSGDRVTHGGRTSTLITDVPARHKFAASDMAVGDAVYMYGVLVGRAQQPIRQGELISTRNIHHDSAAYQESTEPFRWSPADVSAWRHRTFLGFRRSDGRVGTRNYWIVLPLVFCENRNLSVLQEAFAEELGFVPPQVYRRHVAELVRLYVEGRLDEIANHRSLQTSDETAPPKVFPNVDGIKFLQHEMGCGGTREDSNNLCGLLAGYICHPNVAGATVLSLGCQHAQIEILRAEIARRSPAFQKPLFMFEQQKFGSESEMLGQAIRKTFLGLVEADRAVRETVPLDSLHLGLKCGGSDGFSGISANPAVGHVADIVAALGGVGILSEFPELCGVEQDLINRSVNQQVGSRFIRLMRDYAARAKAVGSGFELNPSPGNIREGLITDAMKSAGAARKGGTSPVTAVLDYPEEVTQPGLNLLCTPGNDVECVTAQVAAGANIVLFTTGLGTPTGNPVAPVIKISSNSELAERMEDIIDFDAGEIINGARIEDVGEALLEFTVQVASGEIRTKAERSNQDNFIPWKRGVSL